VQESPRKEFLYWNDDGQPDRRPRKRLEDGLPRAAQQRPLRVAGTIFGNGELADPWGMDASRRIAAHVRRGAISLSSSSHFALRPYSNPVNPVSLPPGRARLATKPAPTGSGVSVNTIGTVRLVWSNGATTVPPEAKITSGLRRSRHRH